MTRKIIGVCNADIERIKLLILLTEKYDLKRHSNCSGLYTNKEKTVQIEEQEKSLLIKFK